MSVVAKSEGAFGPAGTFGWDGGLGTVGYADPREGLVAVMMTQQMRSSPDASAGLRGLLEAGLPGARLAKNT